jgi:hypothetical protein
MYVMSGTLLNPNQASGASKRQKAEATEPPRRGTGCDKENAMKNATKSMMESAMYSSENTHRVPALVLAAGFTIAVMMGLSALAHTQSAVTASDLQQGLGRVSAATTLVSEAANAPLRVEVKAYRS